MHLNSAKKFNFIFIVFFSVFCEFGFSLLVSQATAVKNLNDTFVIICRDEGGKVDWYGPKGALGVKTRPKVEIATYGMVLLFNQTRSEDSGTYTCTNKKDTLTFQLSVADKYSPHTTDSLTLFNTLNSVNRDEKYKKHLSNKKHKYFSSTSEAPIRFMDSPLVQETVEGQTKLVRCEVKDGEVSWTTENGEQLQEPKYKVIGDGLTIVNVTREDDGYYICKAVQPATGDVIDRRIRLHVHFAPKLLNHYAEQETVFGYIGGVTDLNCEVAAKPPAKFHWYDVNKKKKILYQKAVYQVNVTKWAFGDYKCTATNNLGKLDKFFTLEEGSKPQPPLYVELRAADSDLFDLGINPPEVTEEEIKNEMEPRWYNVQYRVVNNNDSQWSWQEFNITKENDYSLINLEPDTDYEVRAASKNVAGLSDFTNSSIFKTLPSGTEGLFNPCVLLNIFMFNLCILLIGN